MQLKEIERQERIKADALRRKQRARLPPRMEQHVEVDSLRRANEMRRLKEEREGTRHSPFMARPVPVAVMDPTRWQTLQIKEAERQERIAIEAHRRQQQSRLPPRMEHAKTKDDIRRKEGLDKVRQEMRSEEKWTPRVGQYPPPAVQPFQSKPSNKERTVPTPFALRIDSRKGASRPSRTEKERVETKMRRDEVQQVEMRWPYVSTRGQAPVYPPPNFERLHAKAAEPRTTTSAELRRAATEEERLKKDIRRERQEKSETQRQAAMVERSKAVAAELQLGSLPEQRRREERELERLRQQWKQEAKEKQLEFEAKHAEMQARVAQRPYLFQQATIDVKIVEERQRMYDKVEDTLRKTGLAHLLDYPAE